jgi:hypothetical protein
LTNSIWPISFVVRKACADWHGPFYFGGKTMAQFQGKRVAHEYVQTNDARPERVFPLLCPVREADWVPGWQYRLLYSQSGIAEAGCVFTTPNGDGTETTWIVTKYEPAAFRIEFAWVQPGRVAAQISIVLEDKPRGQTSARIRYTYTGLSAEGNREVEGFGQRWFEQKMQGWEAAINDYLRTGKKIEAGTTP